MAEEKQESPRWSTTTKLVIALTVAAIMTALFIQFRNVVGPLMLAFVLAYLIHPVAIHVYQRTNLPWRLVVSILFILLIIMLLGLAAWGGITILEQVQSLIGFLQTAINDLPAIIADLSNHPLHFGPFVMDFNRLDLAPLSNQILGIVQPILARLGNMVGSFASSAASTLGWFLYMLLISYFILSETGGQSGRLIYLHIPGYEEDLDRMGLELSRIWNAFLRRQSFIILMTVSLYTFLLGVLGVHYYFGLALLAGMARFIPYVGPLVAWITYGLVSYFQGVSLFGMPQMSYALMVVGIAWVTDNIIDSLISPRIMADALKVHPAAVMVAVLVGANLFGITGVILSAPVFASLKLIMGYIIRKLSDSDPWEDRKVISPPTHQLRPMLERVILQIERVREGGVWLFAWVQQKLLTLRKKNRPID